VQDQAYFDSVKDLSKDAEQYFSLLSQDDKDMMSNTREMVKRMRFQKEVQFNEGFKKRFMTRDYGNYEKYEKNYVSEKVDKGIGDSGQDLFEKHYHEMMLRLNTEESTIEKRR